VGSIACGAVLSVISRNQIATGRLGEVLLAAEDRLTSPALEHLHATQPGVISVRPRRGSHWAAGAGMLLVLGIGGAWLYHGYAAAMRRLGTVFSSTPRNLSSPHPSVAGGVEAPASAPLAQAASPSVPSPQSVLELLSAARIAFRDQRWLPGQFDGALNGDSALELYGQVLRQDPQNDEALAGVKRLLVIGGNRITTDVGSGQLDDATRLLDAFKAAGVASSDLQPWVSAISAAQPKWLAQRAAQTIAAGDFKAADELIAEATGSGADAATVKSLRSQEAAKRVDLQIRAMARQVDAAVQAGVLLPPATDNARTRLAAMRSIARTDSLTLQAQQEVQAALVQEGERATQAAQFDTAERDLNAAADLGSSTLLTLATRHLQAARDAAARTDKVAAALTPREANDPSRALSLAGSADTAPASLPPTYIAARPTRPLPGSYPSGAKGRDGSVVVEFTLSANGKASNLTVVQADPPGVFDRAAITTVRHGRYSTTDLVNRRPARARIKVRFSAG
jgi:TonB family protein